MKIAISTDNGMVSQHFGRCPEFTIIEIEGKSKIKQENITNPGHHPGFLPKFFSEMGVNVVIAGGAGQRAQVLFKEKNIELLVGISGTIDEISDKLVNGELKGGESFCNPGKGKGYGIDKTVCDSDDGVCDH